MGRDVVVCGIKADILRGQSGAVPPEVVNGIEEVFAVVASGICELHQEREFNFQKAVPAAEHIEGMSEEPGFIVAVPPSCGIRVRIMAAAAFPVRAGFAAGGKMPAIRGGM